MEETAQPLQTQNLLSAGKLSRRDIAKAVRTRQWAKNVLLFAGFVFAGHLRAPLAQLEAEIFRVILGFVCFCGLSATAYLINDWNDIERDRLHPLKCNRPLASGRLSKKMALLLMAASAAVALLCASVIILLAPGAWGYPQAALCYFNLTLSYSFFLKHEVIIDVIALASGFVVRVVAGCLILPVAISPWIIFCTFTVALFIALCKRRAELLEMGESSGMTRSVLPLYTVELLNSFIAVAAGLTITAYSLYTFNATNSKALSPTVHGSPLLMTSIPFVVYGIFRFLFLAYSSPVGGEPENMLRDRPLMINTFIWVVLVAILTLVS
jgi:4-hydroxybenzoate polyprenyltransferase